MKLYQKIYSERGKEVSKGGNIEIVTSLLYENDYFERYEVGQIIFSKTESGYRISFFDSEDIGTPRIIKEA